MTRAEARRGRDAEELSVPLASCNSETNIDPKPNNVAEQIAALENINLAELRKRWTRMFGASVPKGLSQDMLIRGIAYKIQEKAYGGLSQAMKRKLNAIAKQIDDGDLRGFDTGPALKSGAKLIREWQAQTYQVTVLDDGFEFNGNRYRSLSMIAREITGVRWSGPKFFGLKKEKVDA